jgi:hypothetical protein
LLFLYIPVTANSGGSVVPFKRVKVTNGISTISVGKIKQTGTFTCETADLYLILAFIITKKNGAVTGMYRNSNLIAYGYPTLIVLIPFVTLTLLKGTTLPPLFLPYISTHVITETKEKRMLDVNIFEMYQYP